MPYHEHHKAHAANFICQSPGRDPRCQLLDEELLFLLPLVPVLLAIAIARREDELVGGPLRCAAAAAWGVDPTTS